MQIHVPQRFVPTALFVGSGLLVWAAAFVFTYIFVALACERGFAQTRIAGLAIVPFVSGVANALAGVATVVIAVRALHRLRERDAASTEYFIDFVAFALSLLASLAVTWTALPPLLLRTGC
jgi:hypothetical protein